MSSERRDFSNFELGDDIYTLAGGVLPEMAHALDFELPERPDEATLRAFIGHVGPAKWSQDNVALIQNRLGNADDPLQIASDWVEQSGSLLPLNRSFAKPELTTPAEVDAAFVTGGVARWMLRRAGRLVTHVTQGNRVGRVYLPVGNREMKESEHYLVGDYAQRNSVLPTEQNFADEYIAGILNGAGLKVEPFAVESDKGSEIMRQFIAGSRVLHGTALAVGNAATVIQTAGEFRLAGAASEFEPNYDSDGNELFMISDGIDVARHGESVATHQNPYAALGHIARNALFVYRNQPKS